MNDGHNDGNRGESSINLPQFDMSFSYINTAAGDDTATATNNTDNDNDESECDYHHYNHHQQCQTRLYSLHPSGAGDKHSNKSMIGNTSSTADSRGVGELEMLTTSESTLDISLCVQETDDCDDCDENDKDMNKHGIAITLGSSSNSASGVEYDVNNTSTMSEFWNISDSDDSI